jgi:hypothetical protein
MAIRHFFGSWRRQIEPVVGQAIPAARRATDVISAESEKNRNETKPGATADRFSPWLRALF